LRFHRNRRSYIGNNDLRKALPEVTVLSSALNACRAARIQAKSPSLPPTGSAAARSQAIGRQLVTLEGVLFPRAAGIVYLTLTGSPWTGAGTVLVGLEQLQTMRDYARETGGWTVLGSATLGGAKRLKRLNKLYRNMKALQALCVWSRNRRGHGFSLNTAGAEFWNLSRCLVFHRHPTPVEAKLSSE
jgi:hypothetical protein